MNTMINCLKQSDYNEEACANEVTAFLNCVKDFQVSLDSSSPSSSSLWLSLFFLWQKGTLEAKEKAKAGIFTNEDGVNRYPKAFIDKMLKMYKTPRKVDDGPEVPV